MKLGVTNLYDLQERGQSSLQGVKAKLVRENRNQSSNVAGFRFKPNGVLTSFNDDWFEDLWSAQVLTLWLTDARGWGRNFPEQIGFITANGYNPQDVSPLSPSSNGRVTNSLQTILKPVYMIGDGIIQGPDGIYGNGSDSMMAEYARTGKLFGANVPSNVRAPLDRILNSITSNRIEEALQARSQGATTSNEAAVQMDGSTLSGDAQINSGMEQTRPSRSLGQTFKNIAPIVKSINADMISRIMDIGIPQTIGIEPSTRIPSTTTTTTTTTSQPTRIPSTTTTSQSSTSNQPKPSKDEFIVEDKEDSTTATSEFGQTEILTLVGSLIVVGGALYLYHKNQKR